jgi:anti-sigma factor RsiW
MTQQISFETLVDYAEGRLDDTERANVAARLADDPAAFARLAEIQQLMMLMRDDANNEDAPSHVIQRASRLLRQRKATAPTSTHLLRRLVAVLMHDSAASPALGLRAAGDSATRQLLYTAESIDVDIRITPQTGGFVVAGQMLGPESDGLVTLAGDTAQLEATLNDLGEFVLPVVSAGRYKLTLRTGDAEVSFPALELGASTLNS